MTDENPKPVSVPPVAPTERQPRPGAIPALLGGPLGVSTPPALLFGGLLGVSVLADPNLQGPGAAGWEEIASAVGGLAVFALLAGMPIGWVGAAFARRVRRRRHADWSDARTAFAGAYFAGTLAAAPCGCFGLAGFLA